MCFEKWLYNRDTYENMSIIIVIITGIIIIIIIWLNRFYLCLHYK